VKSICVLGPREAEALSRNIAPDCSRHFHIRRIEAIELTNKTSDRSGDMSAEWIGPRHIRIIRTFPIRGLSCKIGDELAIAIQLKEPWAAVMYANQRMQRERASSNGTGDFLPPSAKLPDLGRYDNGTA
jgi:hypothetical protein